MEKVAIYCRLSEEDRDKRLETDDSNSIQNQKAMLMEYSISRAGKYITFTAMITTPVLTGTGLNSSVC